MKTQSLLSFFLVLFYSSLHSQNITIKHLKYEAIGINEGLSQGLVNCMLQDRYGFMWFGTKDGLNRYDGYQFTIFRHDIHDEGSIGGNFIQTLFEDSHGRLWIGTQNNGLDLFERETERFIHFVPSDSDSLQPDSASDGNSQTITGLSSVTVWSISEDKQGNIWVCTSYGIDVIASDNKTQNRFSIIHTNIRRAAYPITTTPNGRIYIDRTLHQIRNDEQPLDYHHLKVETVTAASFDFTAVKEKTNLGLSWGVLPDIFRKQDWFFCESSLVCVDDRSNKVLQVLKTGTMLMGVLRNAVIDSNGIILFVSGWYLYELNTHTGTFTQIDFNNFNKENRGLDAVMKDRSGTLWMSTNGYGLLKYNTGAEKFHHTGNLSVAFLVPTQNNLVFIEIYPQYLTFDPQRGEFLDPKKGYQLVSFGNDYTSLMIPQLDDSKHRHLIGQSNKLYCYDSLSKTGIEYTLPVPPPDDPGEFQQQILEDHSGIIWIATRSGLFRFDEDKPSWKRYINVHGDTTTLSTENLFSLCLDPGEPEKYLWIGTNGGGLNRMDMTTGKFISYTTHDGLPNNVVYGVLNDDEGNLWLSTNKGLSCFNPEKKTFKNYEEKDGLQSNEFNHRASCRLPNGLLVFGGVNGFNYFNPKDISDNHFIPQVLITDVKVRNKSVSFREKNSPLTQPAYLTNKITLPYSENMISFEFASMDFSRPEKNVFQYKLQGFDHDWVQSGTDHSATYTNLDPGTYTFLLKGSNSDGVWNEQPTSMQLIILPPWYMTWWFRTLLVAAAVAILYGIYRYRLQQTLKLQGVRNRIARDLHDEIGANLSSISIFSQVANEKTDHQSAELNSWLKKINEYTQSSLDAINDIVWVINARNDRFENIISRMRILAAELFEARNYDLQLSLDESINEVKLGMEERKNFYLIYKEALNNIVKYANCSTVMIELKWNRPVVHLIITDNGNGFDVLKVEEGNGLLNMQKRAETLKGNLSIHSATGKGTSVELEFTV